jgi:SAM-dependent methyltransferase
MTVKQTKYSFENPEVWVSTSEENAKKEIPFLIKLFKKYGKVKSILDVGCGMGRHTHLLSKEGYKCEGVEPHPKMIEYAKRHYPNVTYKVKSMQEVNYKNQFDAVMCIFSIIVFNKSNEEAMKTFSNFHRALKKDGILVLETFNCINWIANPSFRKEFEEIDKKRNEKTIYREWIDTNNQSYVSERTYFDLITNKKKGSFTKESRMFFPLELKFFLEQSGFKVLDMFSADDLSKMTFKDTTLDKRRILVVARKK